jgi:hypothetical protein
VNTEATSALTLQDLGKVPMAYTFGYTAEDHSLRQYKTHCGKIAKQVHTPRNPKTMEWGQGRSAYMLTATGEEFETVQTLLDAINTRPDLVEHFKKAQP